MVDGSSSRQNIRCASLLLQEELFYFKIFMEGRQLDLKSQLNSAVNTK